MEVDEWIANLAGGDEGRAESAVRELARLHSSSAPAQAEHLFGALQALLAAPDSESRWWAARALAEIKDSRSIPLLVRALHDPDRSVSYCAAVALRQQPSPQAVPDLVALLENDDRMLAHLASDALAASGEQAVPSLIEVLQKGSQPARLEAVRALAKIGDHRSIPALFAALDEDSALLEHWANEGLERMGIGMAFFKPT